MNRLLVNKDWITLLLLGIIFLIVITSLVDSKRLKYLFALPYSNTYLLNYPSSPWQAFNALFFVISNLIIGLFIYLIIDEFLPEKALYTTHLFIEIIAVILSYWVFKYLIGKYIAFLFEIKKWHNSLIFTKNSYFYSTSLYLLFFLVFIIYFFENHNLFFYITLGTYSILLLIRYFLLILIYKKSISVNLFYFILYLCALEIAPLLIAIKIVLKSR